MKILDILQREYIRDVLEFEQYIRGLRKVPPERKPPVFTIEPHLDRGEFGFGLDTWKEPEEVQLSWVDGSGAFRITRGRYPCTHVGMSDVIIEGENGDCKFTRAPVMFGEQRLIGLGLISNLSRVYYSP